MTDEEIAATLTAAVQAVDGVTTVYPAAPALATAVADVAATLAGTTPPPAVSVTRTDDGVDVRTRIGIADDARTPEVVRQVADLLGAEVRRELGADQAVRVHVQASSIG